MSTELKLVQNNQNIPTSKMGRKVILTENGRVCLKCQKPKSWDEFATDVHGFNKKTATCSICKNEKGRNLYKSDPKTRRIGIKNRPDKLKRDYGITFSDVVRTLDQQHGMCANIACDKKISLEGRGRNRAMIDHNHTTGKFRALLCMQCNLMLGILEKQEKIVLGLMNYLVTHNR